MGWGVIDVTGSRLSPVGQGVVRSRDDDDLAERLLTLFRGLEAVLAEHRPQEAAVEKTFVNRDAGSALKLGQARAVCLLAPAAAGLSVHEYAPNFVKKAVVGVGHAGKTQVGLMVSVLLPGCGPVGTDAADALAVAITHAHHGAGTDRIAEALARADAEGGREP